MGGAGGRVGRATQASAGASGEGPGRGRAPRLSALQRREDIVSKAVLLFAEQGFSGTTHTLAARMGVRQALIYRYFPSKDALVEAALRRVTETRWQRDLRPLFDDRSVALEDRLAAVYGAYREQDEAVAVRLLTRAALEGLPLPPARGPTLTSQILQPLLAELRHEARLPDLSRRPPLPEERELALMLHGAIVQQAVREHIHRTPAALGRGELIRLTVATFLAGARDSVRRLHPRPARSDGDGERPGRRDADGERPPRPAARADAAAPEPASPTKHPRPGRAALDRLARRV